MTKRTRRDAKFLISFARYVARNKTLSNYIWSRRRNLMVVINIAEHLNMNFLRFCLAASDDLVWLLTGDIGNFERFVSNP